MTGRKGFTLIELASMKSDLRNQGRRAGRVAHDRRRPGLLQSVILSEAKEP
jgi:hypothetical protein